VNGIIKIQADSVDTGSGMKNRKFKSKRLLRRSEFPGDHICIDPYGPDRPSNIRSRRELHHPGSVKPREADSSHFRQRNWLRAD